MAAINSTTLNKDQEKFLVGKLLARSYLNLTMGSLCDKLQMKDGAGLTAYMVRYARMNVPVAAMTEGVIPTENTFTLEEVTVTLDQWGDYVILTDVVELTTKHPVMEQAQKLLADNAARVMDREITVVMLAGTNVTYGDGSVTARNAITGAMIISDGLLKDARATLTNAGAPPFGGPAGDAQNSSKGYARGSGYILVCGPEVVNDIMTPSVNYGSFVNIAAFTDPGLLLTGEVGKWLNFRVVESNFIPRFTRLGNTTVAASGAAAMGLTGLTVTGSSGPGGLANGTYYWKLTRKDLQRGFEEVISIAHTTATGGASGRIQFALPSTAGYVYNVYFDKTSGGGTSADSNLGLVAQNQVASATVNVDAVAGASTAQPPANIENTVSLVHPVFIVAQEALAWVGFYNTKILMSPATATKDDPLAQKRTIGYKYFGKSVIKDQTRLLRLEVCSS